ncbi:hypothetical protein [Vampirovibrio sp.]|uniref:hypothetical protein n=1 Tax=Vampirovibrio sp. TaxID=2717857 RepID=UPI003593E59E
MMRNHPLFKVIHQACVLGLMLAVFSFFISPQPAFALRNGYGFAPQKYQNGYTYGNGIYFAPYRFTVYTEPKTDAPAIGTFRWSHQTAGNTISVFSANGDEHSVYADHTFFCFYPQLDVAMMAVVGDTDDGWVEIVYDQAGHKTGWVQAKAPSTEAEGTTSVANPKSPSPEPVHFGLYQTWLEFMKLNAKASGIYWLSGVKEYNRSIRSSDADEAKMVPVTIIRDLKVRHLRGNWLLVEVLDFQRNTPIGWVRWRDDDGNLMVFPNISGKHLPIVTTTF